MKPHLQPLPIYLFFLIYIAFCLPASSQVWNREVADSSGNDLGNYCKIALDQSGNPVIVYVDSDFWDLKYAERINGKWTARVIDSSGYTGWSAGIVMDNNYVPHICYDNGTFVYEPAATFGTNYMTLEEDEWVKETLVQNEGYLPTSSTSIDLTSEGDPVIGYLNFMDDGYYYLAFRRNGEWEQIKSPYKHAAVKMQLKSDDTPVILFIAGSGLLFVSYDENTDTWNEFPAPYPPITNSQWRADMDFVIDQNDHIHFVGNLMVSTVYPFWYVTYLYYDWVSWNDETITYFSMERNNRIALDQNGYPAILTTLEYPDQLVLFKNDGQEWSSETVDPNCKKFNYADLIFDQNNLPHIIVHTKPQDIVTQKEQMAVYYNFVPESPGLGLDPVELNFSEVWTESYRVLPLYIRNEGAAPLVIGGYQLSNTSALELKGSSFPAYIQPGDSLKLTLKFSPEAELTYVENLRFATNDPDHQIVDIPVYGTGVASGSSATLELLVKDIYVRFDYLLIDQNDPLEGVEVHLYINNSPATGIQLTSNEGITVFTELATGNYRVNLFKAAEHPDDDIDCSMNHSLMLGPGYNSIELNLADSLFHYQTWLSNKLRKIRETDNEFVPYLNYSDVMDQVSAQMNIWAGDFDPQMTESIARLLLVENMVYDLFEEGYGLGSEMFMDFGELIAFVFYSNDWATRILDFILSFIKAIFEGQGASAVLQEIAQMLMEEIIKQEIYSRVSESIMLAGAKAGFPGDGILMDAWQEVWSEYSYGWNFNFGWEEWGRIITGVTRILKVPFIQGVYIENQTASKIEKGLDYAMDNQYTRTFHDAFMKEIDYVSEEKNTVGIALDAARYLRETANVFMITANIMNWVGSIEIIPFANIIDQVAFYMKIAAYLEVTTALGIATGKFFVVPSNMGKTVDEIYFPSYVSKKTVLPNPVPPGYKTARADPGQVTRLKNMVKSDHSGYPAVLEGIKDKISSGDKMGAASDILLLREAEKEHNNNILRAASPILAVASLATDSIDGFIPMYDSLGSFHAIAGQERLLMYFRLLLAVADTTGDSDDLIMDLIDQNLAADSRLTEQVTDLLDTVTSNMDIPAVLIASVTETDKHRLALNETGSVRVVVMNTGAVTAENVYLSVTSNDALEVTGADSIFIGTLSPGQETAELEMTFTCRDEDFELGLWNLLIDSDNARSFPSSGSFVIGDATTSSPFLKTPEYQEFHVIPNPVTGLGMVTYRLEQQARVKISLFDLSGKQLHVFTELTQQPGSYNLPVDLSPFRSGIYMVVFEKNGIVSATKKVISFTQ